MKRRLGESNEHLHSGKINRHRANILPKIFFAHPPCPGNLVELIGMNSGMMCNYIRLCADQLLLSLGCDRHFKIGNPFEWMETISLQGKTNFFEKRVGEYSKSGVRPKYLIWKKVSDHPPLYTSSLLTSLHVTCYIFCSSWNTHIHTLVVS